MSNLTTLTTDAAVPAGTVETDSAVAQTNGVTELSPTDWPHAIAVFAGHDNAFLPGQPNMAMAVDTTALTALPQPIQEAAKAESGQALFAPLGAVDDQNGQQERKMPGSGGSADSTYVMR
jgi:hypothetical protein